MANDWPKAQGQVESPKFSTGEKLITGKPGDLFFLIWSPKEVDGPTQTGPDLLTKHVLCLADVLMNLMSYAHFRPGKNMAPPSSSSCVSSSALNSLLLTSRAPAFLSWSTGGTPRSNATSTRVSLAKGVSSRVFGGLADVFPGCCTWISVDTVNRVGC